MLDPAVLPHVLIYHEGRFRFLPVDGARVPPGEPSVLVLVERWTTDRDISLDLFRRMYTRQTAAEWVACSLDKKRVIPEDDGPTTFRVTPSLDQRTPDTFWSDGTPDRCDMWHRMSEPDCLVISTLRHPHQRIREDRCMHMNRHSDEEIFDALKTEAEALYGKVTARNPCDGVRNMKDLRWRKREPGDS